MSLPIITAIASIVEGVVTLVGKLKRKPAPNPEYKDEHNWQSYDWRAQPHGHWDYVRVPDFCTYCKRPRENAKKYCPGVEA